MKLKTSPAGTSRARDGGASVTIRHTPGTFLAATALSVAVLSPLCASSAFAVEEAPPASSCPTAPSPPLGAVAAPPAELYEGELPTVLYRVDTRPPSEVFSTGFSSWPATRGTRAEMDLVRHAANSQDHTSGYVSTTSSLQGAQYFANSLHAATGQQVYLYEIAPSSDMYNVPQSLASIAARTQPLAEQACHALHEAKTQFEEAKRKFRHNSSADAQRTINAASDALFEAGLAENRWSVYASQAATLHEEYEWQAEWASIGVITPDRITRAVAVSRDGIWTSRTGTNPNLWAHEELHLVDRGGTPVPVSLADTSQPPSRRLITDYPSDADELMKTVQALPRTTGPRL